MKNPDYNEVRMFESKPNKMFPDWMTQRLRFLRYAEPVKCAVCGSLRKNHWTMLMSFKGAIFGKHLLTLEPEPTVHLPMTPVCRDHILMPEMPTVKKGKKNEQKM